jgi:luciferase family oxidoreductase group 1
MRIRLGALDFSPVTGGIKPADAIWETIELSKELDALGYSRFWIAEHHGSGVAHSCPEILIPVIAGVTHRIRVGSAGILLRMYSPLKVAKTFRLLHAIYPRRIDLGIARGTAPEVEQKMAAQSAEEDFDAKTAELIGYMRGSRDVIVNPQRVAPPEIWMLGSNTKSMELAALHGTAFCFAYMGENETNMISVLETYRRTFVPCAQMSVPKWSLAMAGICADTRHKAESLLRDDYPIKFRPVVLGSPGDCAETVSELAEKTGTEEFIFADLCSSASERLRSYTLLAERLL